MTLVDSRKFVNSSFGLSISSPPANDADWPPSYGNPHTAVNQFVHSEGANFLSEGGRLVLGHGWRRGVLKYFVAKFKYSRSFRPVPPDSKTGKIPPAIMDFLAWPTLQPTTKEQAEMIQLVKEGLLEFHEIRPDGFDETFLRDGESSPAKLEFLQKPAAQFARIRALTAMRRELVLHTDFRLCMGGEFGKVSRRLPGVLEEALFTYLAGKPLYISGALGGVSKAMADLLLQRRIKGKPEEVFFTPEPTAQLMHELAAKFPITVECEKPSTTGGWSAQAEFEKISLDALARQSGLTPEQYINLLATTDIERAMAWVYCGVRNLRSTAVG